MAAKFMALLMVATAVPFSAASDLPQTPRNVILVAYNGDPATDSFDYDQRNRQVLLDHMQGLEYSRNVRIVALPVSSLVDLGEASQRNLRRGEHVAGLVLAGHGSITHFHFNRQERWHGQLLGNVLADQLEGLPIAPELNVFVTACSCGFDRSETGFMRRLADGFESENKELGVRNIPLNVFAFQSLSSPSLLNSFTTRLPEGGWQERLGRAYSEYARRYFLFFDRHFGRRAANASYDFRYFLPPVAFMATVISSSFLLLPSGLDFVLSLASANSFLFSYLIGQQADISVYAISVREGQVVSSRMISAPEVPRLMAGPRVVPVNCERLAVD